MVRTWESRGKGWQNKYIRGFAEISSTHSQPTHCNTTYELMDGNVNRSVMLLRGESPNPPILINRANRLNPRESALRSRLNRQANRDQRSTNHDPDSTLSFSDGSDLRDRPADYPGMGARARRERCLRNVHRPRGHALHGWR